MEIRRLNEEDFKEAWTLIDAADSYLTVPRSELPDSTQRFSKSFWVKYFESNQQTYRCFGTFIDGKLVHITTLHLWSVMPYATSGGAFTSPGWSGKDYLRISVWHNRELLNNVFIPEGIRRAYWVSAKIAPRMRKALAGDEWLYMLEEKIPAGYMSKYWGFTLLTGTKPFPIDLYVHSFTSKSDA